VSKGRSVRYRFPSIEEIEEDPSFIDDVLEHANSPALSITASAQRIGAEYPDYPLNFIDEHVID
jgi:hypothetical protein